LTILSNTSSSSSPGNGDCKQQQGLIYNSCYSRRNCLLSKRMWQAEEEEGQGWDGKTVWNETWGWLA